MHLPDGLVHGGMAIAGYGACAALVGLSLWRVERLADPGALVPRAALVAAVFFAGSLVSIPVPPTSVHLMLSGLVGVLLGWLAVPVVLIGLFFQAILFGHGGVTTLGLNGLILGLPALVAFAGWRPSLPGSAPVVSSWPSGSSPRSCFSVCRPISMRRPSTGRSASSCWRICRSC